MENGEPVGLGDHPEGLDPAGQCPPDFLVRAAVLEPNESILSHVAECQRCTGTYLNAMGAYCSDAPRPRTDRTANWIAKLEGSIQSALPHPGHAALQACPGPHGCETSLARARLSGKPALLPDSPRQVSDCRYLSDGARQHPGGKQQSRLHLVLQGNSSPGAAECKRWALDYFKQASIQTAMCFRLRSRWKRW